MYNADLREELIELEYLFLDPNNPRFDDIRSKVPSAKIVDTTIQANAEQRLANHGIRELANSILRNGFLPLDRIVVKEIDEHPGKYVVVEGNRRLAALRSVANQIDGGEVEAEDLTDEYLENLRDSIRKINCLVYTGSEADIAWILQGIRHLSGIKDWSPSQKAELIVRQIEEEGLTFSAVGEMLGLTAIQVGKYYRALKALDQMKNDDEYGGAADKKLFTLFDEAYSKKKLRAWLGWDDQEHKFKNETNLKSFYSWIVPDPEHNNERRIHDTRHMTVLNKLIDPVHSVLLQKFDDWDITIERADLEMAGQPPAVKWQDKLAQAEAILKGIPLVAITESGDLAQKLSGLKDLVASILEKVEK